MEEEEEEVQEGNRIRTKSSGSPSRHKESSEKKSLVLCGELKQTDCLSESALLCYFGWQHLSHQTIAEPVYRSRGVLASDPTCAVGGTSHAAERDESSSSFKCF